MIAIIGLSSTSHEELLKILDRVELMYWNDVRLNEIACGEADKLKTFEDVKVIPVLKQFKTRKNVVHEDSIVIRSFLNQGYEPDHL